MVGQFKMVPTTGLPFGKILFLVSPFISWDSLHALADTVSQQHITPPFHMMRNPRDDLRVSYREESNPGEDVGQLLFRGYVPHINDLVFYQTYNVVVTNVNVLCSRMLDWILRDSDSTKVATIDCYNFL